MQGKTTLFNVTSGLLKPNEGNIQFGDVVMTDLSPYRRAKLGLGRTFQRLELFPSLTVKENIQVAAEIRREWSGNITGNSNINKIVERVIRLTGLGDLRSKSVADIPTGKARLVELTLVQEPKMLFLDEPASGQNDKETRRIRRDIKSLK